MRRPDVFVGVFAVMFLGFGLYFLMYPVGLAVVDMAPTTPTGFADARADYGGCALGIGLFLLMAAFRASWIRPALWFIGLTMACYAFGRILGVVLDGPPRRIIYILLAAELVGSVLAFAKLRISRPSP